MSTYCDFVMSMNLCVTILRLSHNLNSLNIVRYLWNELGRPEQPLYLLHKMARNFGKCGRARFDRYIDKLGPDQHWENTVLALLLRNFKFVFNMYKKYLLFRPARCSVLPAARRDRRLFSHPPTCSSPASRALTRRGCGPSSVPFV